jgi:hypothetical protein
MIISGAKLREKRHGFIFLFVVFKYFRHLLNWKLSCLRSGYRNLVKVPEACNVNELPAVCSARKWIGINCFVIA